MKILASRLKENQNWLYPLALGFVVLILAILNYEPGTWLTGWDNIHPEFNYWINLERHFTAAWQEYQGLGVQAAMGHASDIPRIFILFVLDIFLPTSMVRYTYMFLMVFWGALGFHYLVKWLIYNSKISFSDSKIHLYSFLGSLFFIFNLGTLQQFYTPISMFPTQWAFLPWLFLFLFRSLKDGGYKNYLAFLVLSFFAAPMAYTPTLYVVYAFAVAIICMFIFFANIKDREKLKQISFRIFNLFLITIAANGFWLFSFVNFYFNSGADTVIDSQMNQMFSLDSYAQNRAAGGFENVAILKGFWFNNEDYYEESDSFGPLMRDWDSHIGSGVITAVGYVFFGVILIGLIYTFRKKVSHRVALVTLFFLSIFILMNSNPPFGFIFDFLRSVSPTFSEALRFPFTKLSPLATLMYAIFFTLGLLAIDKGVYKLTKTNWQGILAVSVVFGLLLFNIPALSGQFINPGLKQQIPDEYFQMFDYFEEKPQELRIANIPQDRFWAWYHYEWGYRGSGFIWYGLRQPVLDRAFDVWSGENEEYYQSMSQALYTEDFTEVAEIMQKYRIGWLVYDDSLRLLDGLEGKQKEFYREEVLPGLLATEGFREVQTYGNIRIIEYTPIVENPGYILTGDDVGSSESNSIVANEKGFERIIDTDSTETQYIYKYELTDPGTVVLPSYSEEENYLGWQMEGDRLVPVLPEIYLNDQEQEPITPATSARVNRSNNIFSSDIDILDDGEEIVMTRSELRKLEAFRLFGNENVLETIQSNLELNTGNCDETKEDSEFDFQNTSDGINIESLNASACIFSGGIDASSSRQLLKFEIAYKPQVAGSNIRVCGLSSLTNECVNPIDSKTSKSGLGENTNSLFIKQRPNEIINFHIYLDAGNDKREVEVTEVEKTSYVLSGNVLLPEIKTNERSIEVEAGDLLEIRYPRLNYGAFSAKTELDLDSFRKCSTSGENSSLSTQVSSGNILKVNNTDSEACTQITYPSLPLDANYILEQDSKFIASYPLRFCATNYAYNSCHSEFLTYTKSGQTPSTQLVPRFGNEDTMVGWNLNISSRSRGDFESVNQLGEISVNFFPYDYLKGIMINSDSGTEETKDNLQIISQDRIAPFWYQAEISGKGELVLAQAHNTGWKVFGSETGENGQYAGWANSWQVLPEDGGNDNEVRQIDVIYLPQIYEIIGQVLFLGAIYLFYLGWLLRRLGRNN